MFFKRFFVWILVVVGLNTMVYGGKLSSKQIREKTMDYICENVMSDTTCSGSEMDRNYEMLNEYHRKIITEINSGKIDTMIESLDQEIKDALNDIKDVTNVYDYQKILLAAIKYSNYASLANQFLEKTLVPLENAFETSDPISIWTKQVEILGEELKQYNLMYKDPYESDIESYWEIGRIMMDETRRLKSSADAAWSISKVTFLAPYTQTLEKAKSALERIQNVETDYVIATELLPMISALILKEAKGEEMTFSDLEELSEKCSAVVETFDKKWGDSKPSKALKIFLVVRKLYKLAVQRSASILLEQKYKHNPSTSYILSTLDKLLTSNLYVTMSDAVQIIVKLVPISDVVSDWSEAILKVGKALGDYELNLRTKLHQVSLYDEYLKLETQRIASFTRFYVAFLSNYFRENTNRILSPNESQKNVLKAEEPAVVPPKIVFELPSGATGEFNTITAKAGQTVTLYPYVNNPDLRECLAQPYDTQDPLRVWAPDRSQIYTIEADSAAYKLWYYRDGQLQYIPAQYDPVTGKLSFEMPQDKVTIVNLVIDHKDNGHVGVGCGVPREEEAYVYLNTQAEDGDDASTESTDDYQQCIDNGGTEIGCKVGIHRVMGSVDYIGADMDVEIVGDYAYVADRLKGLLIIDISDPRNPILKGSLNADTYQAEHLTVSGNYAYVIDKKASTVERDDRLLIIDITNPTNPILKGHIDFKVPAQDIKVSGNYAYVADSTEGLKIIDITDPSNPKLKGSINAINAQGISINNHYAYIADYEHGVQIIDISDPANPLLKANIDIEGEVNGITIISDSYAYVTGGYIGFKILDIKDPLNPIIKGSMNTSGYINKISVSGDFAYVVGSFFEVIDIKNPANPTLKENISLENGGYGYGIAVSGNYAYVADNFTDLMIIDISNPFEPALKGSVDTNNTNPWAIGISVSGNYAYMTNGNNELKIVNISNPENPKIEGIFSSSDLMAYGVAVSGNYAYVADWNGGLRIIDIGDPENPVSSSILRVSGNAEKIALSGNYAYLKVGNKLKIIDVSDPTNPEFKGSIDIDGAYSVSGNYAYVGDSIVFKIIDTGDPVNPIQKGNITLNFGLGAIAVSGNYVYSVDWGGRFMIIDISKYNNPVLVGGINGIKDAYEINILGKYAYVACDDGVKIIDISQPMNPVLKGNIDTILYPRGIKVSGDYAYVVGLDGFKIIDIRKAIEKYKLMQDYYHSTIYMSLVRETNEDGTVQKKRFTKEWIFNQDITNFTPIIISNTYNGVSATHFIKEGNTLKISLTPDTSKPINKLVVKFTKNGDPVKVSGSDTFWSLTRTNHAPRLADGQVTQLVSATNEPAFLEIATFDGDGDAVSLSVEDDAGGYVDFDPDNPNRLFASFSDGKVVHTIKIALSDGKEKIVKEFHVLQFDNASIEDFYTDVSATGGYIYDGIAFGTLKGVIWGQPDPNDPTKRIFRPTDPASLAEALKMIINAEVKAGLVQLKSSNAYYSTYPKWAMPYYTYAVDSEALENVFQTLNTIYPSRETIAKLIVKTLKLENKAVCIDLNITFDDEEKFSNETMLNYAKLTRAFGLFMITDRAKPQDTISRADLAMVIEKIFMIPTAMISTADYQINYGEQISISLENIHAESIDSVTYRLRNASTGLQHRYCAHGASLNNPINTALLSYPASVIGIVLNNGGVSNVILQKLNVTMPDRDSDGLEDSSDAWPDDPRYQYDANKNSIPDKLDLQYNLFPYTNDSTVIIGGELVKVADIIRDNGISSDSNGERTALHIQPIDDIPTYVGGTIPAFRVEANASNGVPLEIRAVSSDPTIVTVQVNEHNLTFDVTAETPGRATVTVTASLGERNVTETFDVIARMSQISIVDETGEERPVEESDYTAQEGKATLKVTAGESGVAFVLKLGDQNIDLHVTVPGASVKFDAKNRARIVLPTKRSYHFDLDPNGTARPYLKGALLPTRPLPLGTRIKADTQHIIMTVPLKGSMTFRRQK